MTQMSGVLRPDEAAVFALRGIYEKYGYSRFKMSKFEEYDLYVKNKDFLVSEGVITFMDNDGRLLALKPDVTLSIVKNFVPEKGCVQKVYYNENVYRISEGGSFKEIMQTGLECMGDIGLYDVAEVIMLAAKSLKSIDGKYILDISHLGVISAITEAAGLSKTAADDILRCIGQKNMHGIARICEENGVEKFLSDALNVVVTSYGSCEKVISSLRKIDAADIIKNPLDELEALFSLLKRMGADENVDIDFSIVNDMNYYSGIVFRGYIEGLPAGVLSGGEYANLLKKLGKKGGAIGFAVYLDMLERLSGTRNDYDVDVVIKYADGQENELADAVKQYEQKGLSVFCAKKIPQKLRYRELCSISGKGGESQ